MKSPSTFHALGLIAMMLTACSSGTISSPDDEATVAANPADPAAPGSSAAPAPTTAPPTSGSSPDAGAPPTAPPGSPPSSATSLDIGVTDTIDDLGFNFATAHADGLTRTTFYTMWRDLEPSKGVYKFGDIDDMSKRAAAAGLKLSVEIEITNTDCVENGMSDAFCVTSKFPTDQPFSRTGAGFADPAIASRLSALLGAIAARYDSSVLTHVFLGNEVDRYIQIVLHDNKIDLTPGFVNMLGTVRSAVAAAHPKRPKLGTVVEFQPSPEYATVPSKACANVDVLGLTMYPTEPDAEGSDPAPAKIQRWLAAARTSIAGACRLAVTEVGASAVSPFGTPESQQAVAQAIIDWLHAQPTVYDYATWFAMSDNPDPSGDVFGGMGLMTRTGVPRPVYKTWLAAGKP